MSQKEQTRVALNFFRNYVRKLTEQVKLSTKLVLTLVRVESCLLCHQPPVGGDCDRDDA